MVCAEFTLRNARRAISDFAARFLWLNPPACRGHSREKDNAPSPLSAPSVRTPRACSITASPVLPAVPGCCAVGLHSSTTRPIFTQTGTCRGEAPPSCCARPFGRLKAPLGLSLLRFAAQTRTTLFLLRTKSFIVWRKIGVWRSFRWKFIKRKSLKLLGTSRSFRLCFA